MVSKNLIKIVLMLGILLLVGCSGQDPEANALEKDTIMKMDKAITLGEKSTSEADTKAYSLKITEEEVAGHDSTDDCWIIFDGEVYDITSFINNHHGRNVMHEGCGREATELFIVEKMGFDNLQTAMARLQDYKV